MLHVNILLVVTCLKAVIREINQGYMEQWHVGITYYYAQRPLGKVLPQTVSILSISRSALGLIYRWQEEPDGENGMVLGDYGQTHNMDALEKY